MISPTQVAGSKLANRKQQVHIISAYEVLRHFNDRLFKCFLSMVIFWNLRNIARQLSHFQFRV